MTNLITAALKWGLIGGLAIILLQTIFMLFNLSVLGGTWGIIAYLPLLFCMIYGGITIRKEIGGDIGFPKSLLAVFIIATLGSLLLNIYVYQLWVKVIDPTFIQRALDVTEAKIRDTADKQGITDEQLQIQLDYVKNMDWQKLAYIISSVCTIVLSLLVSIFVSRPDTDQHKPIIQP